MSDAATPVAPAPQPAPAAPPAKSPEGESVTLSKAEYDELSRNAARAAEAQKRADRMQSAMQRGTMGGFQAKPQAEPPKQPSREEQEAHLIEEDRKAERGLLRVAIDPEFRDVFDSDPTLRGLITNSPLSVLPLFAPDALDADDAIDLVKAELRKRKDSIKKPAAPTEPPKQAPASTPPAGSVNPNSALMDEEYEKAKKHPTAEGAVAGMIKAKLKGMASSKS